MAKRKRKTGKTSLTRTLAQAQALVATDLPGAVLTYGKILQEVPDHPRALAALRGLTAAQKRRVIDACMTLVKNDAVPHALALSGILSRLMPSDAPLAAFEARALAVDKRPAEALERLAPALAAHPDQRDVQISHGVCRALVEDYEAAVEILGPLDQKGELDAEAGNVLAISLSFQGKIEEAQEVLLRNARAGRLQISGLYNLARQRDLNDEPAIVEKLKAILADQTTGALAQEMAAFALAKVADDRKDFGEAFQYLAVGNSRRPDADIHLYMTKIRATCTIVKQAEQRITAPSLIAAPQQPRPVFIVGMPRTGTTLIEQILLRHSRVETLGESPQLAEVYNRFCADGSAAPLDPRAIREAYFEALPDAARDAEVVLDKMPPNALTAGLALKAMPEARMIHCRRHPMACGFSAFRLRFAEGYEFSYRFDTIAEFYRLTDQMVTHWRGLFPKQIQSIFYEALTEAPERGIAKLLNFAGLDMEDGLTEYTGSAATVRTASFQQVRRGIYRGSSEVWKNYSEYLLPLMVNLIEEIAHYEVALEAEMATLKGSPSAVSGAA